MSEEIENKLNKIPIADTHQQRNECRSGEVACKRYEGFKKRLDGRNHL